MKRTRCQMKAQLLAEAEVVVDELLDWHENNRDPTLVQVEEVILKLRKQLGRRMAEVVLGDQEAVQPVMAPPCPTCERETRYKGMKETAVESRLGLLHLERGYYHCDGCRVGFFPPG
jgi:hypothetical protein